jgi:hypothetical protein
MPLGRLRPAVMILVQIVDATLRAGETGLLLLFRHVAQTPAGDSTVAISSHMGSANTIPILFSRTPVWDCETILAIANRTIDDTRQRREADSCEAATAAVP